MDSRNKNGLFLHDIHIKKLTGPTSLHVLVPKNDEKLDRSLYRPMIIFLGDYHGKPHHTCNPCEQTENCYDTGNPDFLKLFDPYSTHQFPIDLYVEGNWFWDETRDEFLDYMDNLSALLKIVTKIKDNCFGRTYRGTDEYKTCPTQNMRLHRSDGRYSIIKGAPTIENSLHLRLYERQSSSPFDNAVEPFIRSFPLYFKFSSNYTQEELDRLIPLISKEICKLLYTSKHSAIRKQLKKSMPYFTFQKFVDLFRSLLTNYAYLHTNERDDLMKLIAVCIHDFYMLLRIFKKIKNPPVLCIGIHGESHVKAMTKLLIDHFNYSSRFSVSHISDNYEDVNVCIDLTDRRIDITNDFEDSKKRLTMFLNETNYLENRVNNFKKFERILNNNKTQTCGNRLQFELENGSIIVPRFTLMGRGAYGFVFFLEDEKLKEENINVVAKISNSKQPINMLETEYAIIMSKLVQNGNIPNLPLFAQCKNQCICIENCSFHENEFDKSSSSQKLMEIMRTRCFIAFSEKMDGDFYNLLKNMMEDKESEIEIANHLFSCIGQISMALKELDRYGLAHNDLHSENILIKQHLCLDYKEKPYLQYIRENTFTISHMDTLCVLSDFGSVGKKGVLFKSLGVTKEYIDRIFDGKTENWEEWRTSSLLDMTRLFADLKKMFNKTKDLYPIVYAFIEYTFEALYNILVNNVDLFFDPLLFMSELLKSSDSLYSIWTNIVKIDDHTVESVNILEAYRLHTQKDSQIQTEINSVPIPLNLQEFSSTTDQSFNSFSSTTDQPQFKSFKSTTDEPQFNSFVQL